jgi:hypothetical protein
MACNDVLTGCLLFVFKTHIRCLLTFWKTGQYGNSYELSYEIVVSFFFFFLRER